MPFIARGPSSVISIPSRFAVISRNLPLAPAQIPPIVKVPGMPSMTLIALLSIPPMSMTVEAPRW